MQDPFVPRFARSFEPASAGSLRAPHRLLVSPLAPPRDPFCEGLRDAGASLAARPTRLLRRSRSRLLMAVDPSHIWEQVEHILRRRVTEPTYDMWIAPLRAVRLEGDVLHLAAPPHLVGWLEGRFVGVLQAAAREILGGGGDVRVSANAATPATDTTPAPGPARPELTAGSTFDSFVIGAANRFAHAAALSVAELPGQTYNPLFLHGPPGTGKTHLLHAIGHYVRRYGGGLRVRLTSAEAFTNEFVGAIADPQRAAMAAFKGRYRLADVVLVDDVQYLAAKRRTEEEFLHTFNALHEAGAQLVLTSDRIPQGLGDLDARLRERFASGLVCDLGAPDPVTRVTILRARARREGLHLEDVQVLEQIAARIPSNVRELHGALIRVVAFGSLTGPADHQRADRRGPRRALPGPEAAIGGPSDRHQQPSRRSSARSSPSAATSCCRPRVTPGAAGRVSWRCTSRASTQGRPIRRSAARSPAGTRRC